MAGRPRRGRTASGRAYRFEMPADPTALSTIADQLGFGAPPPAPGRRGVAQPLPARPSSSTLEAFGVTRKGQPTTPPTSTPTSPQYNIGDLLTTEGGSTCWPTTASSRSTTSRHGLPTRWPAAGRDHRGRRRTQPPVHADYPDPVARRAADRVVRRRDVRRPAPASTARRRQSAWPTTRPMTPRPAESAERHDVDVEPAGGAYVLSGGDDAAPDGTPYVIDAKGAKYSSRPRRRRLHRLRQLQRRRWCRHLAGVLRGQACELSVNAARRVPEDAPAADDSAAES